MKTPIQEASKKILEIKSLNTEQITEIVKILSDTMETEKQAFKMCFSDGMKNEAMWREDAIEFKDDEDYYNQKFK